MTITEAVIFRIERLMAENSMTKRELIERSGLPVGTVASLYKKLAKSVNLSTVFLLAKAFGITVTEFLNDEVFDSVVVE